MTELLTLEWTSEEDIFTVRQRGRELGAALGLDGQDQVRLATALSEVGREVVSAGRARVQFSVEADPMRLAVTVVSTTQLPEDPAALVGIGAARRLMDGVSVEPDGAGWAITLFKRLPPGALTDRRQVRRLRESLRRFRVASPLDELREQNAELVRTLDQLTERQQDLVRANTELEETNRGVLAMYSQLSQELEETNRGVVALYAELDEKGRQLAQANEAKTRFLRNVSHELRAPINSVLGLAELLSGSTLDDEQRTQVDYLRSSAGSLLELVNELLDLARAESGRVEVHEADVDLPELFQQLRGTLRPVADTRGVELVVEEPAVPVIRSDEELLARVLRNLLTNALKFTEAGQVRLSARRRESGQHVEIAVSDTGIGIALEDQEKIFEEFFQVPNPLQRPGAGTGLGLPYARRVTERLGGTLELVSQVGQGSTFTVVLPLLQPETVQEPAPDLRDVRFGHVVVVDDDEAFRHVIRGMLQELAERVSEAGDGEEALRVMAEAAPDIVLLDLRMPRLDGAGVLAAMRGDPALREVPVVLLTSVDIDAAVRRAGEPADALMAKGELTRTRLVSAIAHAVSGSGRAR